jgi:hypothetical protein
LIASVETRAPWFIGAAAFYYSMLKLLPLRRYVTLFLN